MLKRAFEGEEGARARFFGVQISLSDRNRERQAVACRDMTLPEVAVTRCEMREMQ